ncbi:histidine kinase [Streptococcus danieliae]|uniref:histidine kinase n=1 Tax=Streptococcus danieliae TaxID=747656 RepID=A0A7Z0LD95_9STRE|nr:histidine kinase dimerization/phosphoacceptor domain-containing protein [Streptococcus danieliae]NYS49269.1 histidine kinase [Streptococcus danieliae]
MLGLSLLLLTDYNLLSLFVASPSLGTYIRFCPSSLQVLLLFGKNFPTLSEKIAEDRERKRIAREIHDTLGHALTGISAGLAAVRVLVDRDRIRAKEQLDNISVVVRDGIRDVRASLHIGYGIYRGRLNLQKVILDLERKLTEA